MDKSIIEQLPTDLLRKISELLVNVDFIKFATCSRYLLNCCGYFPVITVLPIHETMTSFNLNLYQHVTELFLEKAPHQVMHPYWVYKVHTLNVSGWSAMTFTPHQKFQSIKKLRISCPRSTISSISRRIFDCIYDASSLKCIAILGGHFDLSLLLHISAIFMKKNQLSCLNLDVSYERSVILLNYFVHTDDDALPLCTDKLKYVKLSESVFRNDPWFVNKLFKSLQQRQVELKISAFSSITPIITHKCSKLYIPCDLELYKAVVRAEKTVLSSLPAQQSVPTLIVHLMDCYHFDAVAPILEYEPAKQVLKQVCVSFECAVAMDLKKLSTMFVKIKAFDPTINYVLMYNTAINYKTELQIVHNFIKTVWKQCCQCRWRNCTQKGLKHVHFNMCRRFTNAEKQSTVINEQHYTINISTFEHTLHRENEKDLQYW